MHNAIIVHLKENFVGWFLGLINMGIQPLILLY